MLYKAFNIFELKIYILHMRKNAVITVVEVHNTPWYHSLYAKVISIVLFLMLL